MDDDSSEKEEKELVAQPSAHNDVSPWNQRRAELLRRRIEELDRRLALLKSEPTLWLRLRR